MPHAAANSVGDAVRDADTEGVAVAEDARDGVAPTDSDEVGVGGATSAHDTFAHCTQ